MENNQTNLQRPAGAEELRFDLGTFEGFNFRHDQAIDHLLTAEEVVQWNHDAAGEAEFWPAGDHAEVALLFKGRSAVTAGELLALDALLQELGDDSTDNYLRIHYAVSCCGENLADLTRDKLEDLPLQVWEGTSFWDLRKEAAYELFELYYPEAYQAWEKSHCDGLIFDEDRFLDSPGFAVEEIELGDRKALVVVTQ
ncbi:MAG: hypothetical protein HZA90_17325 [Verrucomicrobia bacterium]|nr:hypothetical protein [Verrucomicrobiota bacterium]